MPTLSSDWLYRFYIVVPIALQSVANQQAIAIEPDLNGGDTFSALLSANGSAQEPITHCGASTLASQAGHDSIIALAPQMPGASYFCVDAETEELLSTNTNAQIGNPWAWVDVLQLLGLQQYMEPEAEV